MTFIESFPLQSLVCPACRSALIESPLGLACAGCGRFYPGVAGILDLRLQSDRYLDLDAERTRANRLATIARTTDLMGLATAYYALTGEAEDRRSRFLAHIASGLARGEALAARLPDGGQILEIGCGTGGLLAAVARTGRAIVGVDIAARWLVAARRRLADHGLAVPLLAASAERLPWPDGQFDTIVADSVLEHLDDPALALCEWARVLRPGGQLLIWSPNRYALTTDPHLGLWGLGWLPQAWVPNYVRLRGRTAWPPRTLSASEAQRIAARAGLSAVNVEPPAIPHGWARTRPWPQQSAIRVYNAARRHPGVRGVLRAIGPLWELRATRVMREAA
jgi:ubiquinone/menaquinone biosynthesis C-methylase UbiE